MKNELDFFHNGSAEYTDFHRSMNRMLDDFWPATRRRNGEAMMFSPACDIEETDKQYFMYLDLPGVKKDDIKVTLQDHRLTISGERKEEKREEKKSKHMVERYYGSFQRSLTLPAGTNAEQIHASFENGVLSVTIPKVETARSKQIAIADAKSAANSKVDTPGSTVRIR